MTPQRFVSSLAALFFVFSLGACKSEVDNKTAAGVSDAPAAPATPTPPPANAVDVVKDKSSIEFVGAKVTRDHKGGFRDFSGSVAYENGVPSSIAFDIVVKSIFTDTEKLTGHLQTADFFDAETFPQATFRSTSIIAAPAGNKDNATHMITGTLTMHGVSKELTFPVTVTSDATGTHAMSEFTINRQDWGVSYKGAVDDLIKDEVLIRLHMQFPAAPAPPSTPA